MVSFKSVILLALAATAQVVNSAAIDGSLAASGLKLCTQSKQVTLENSKVVGAGGLTKQAGASPETPRYYSGDTAVTRRKNDNGQYFTVITTGAITDVNGFHLKIKWTSQDGKAVYRIFDLSPVDTCRVQNSADYESLDGAVFVDKK